MTKDAFSCLQAALSQIPEGSVCVKRHTEYGCTPFSDRLKVRTDGRGILSVYPVYEGIELSHLRFVSAQAAFHHAASPRVLEISHCQSGRAGWNLKDGMSVFLGAGDLALHSTNCCSDSVMTFPLGYYEGITLSVNLDLLEKNCPEILQTAGFDAGSLYESFCVPSKSEALPSCPETERIFSPLYSLPESLRLAYFRLKVQELLLYLYRLTQLASPEKGIARHSSSQTELIRAIHDRLIQNPGQRFTIEALSREYLINTSTLKSVFKAVYGQPIAAYMKEYRMRQAMELLRESDAPISDIAAAVGYESAGKFTGAFQDIAHILPSEYRRQHRGR